MGSSQARSRRNSRLLVVVAVIYVPAVLLGRAAEDGVGLVLLATAFLAGLGMIVFAIRTVRHGDELQQWIHLEAMAVAFVALVLVNFTALFAPDWLPRAVPWSDLWLLLSVCWLAGLARAHWRHR